MTFKPQNNANEKCNNGKNNRAGGGFAVCFAMFSACGQAGAQRSYSA
jgi:hypothetical protein